MQEVKDTIRLYEVERRAYHAVRPRFRITELQISPTQKVPWHFHNNVQDKLFPSHPDVGTSLRTLATAPRYSWSCRA
jgi:hypothetical protein